MLANAWLPRLLLGLLLALIGLVFGTQTAMRAYRDSKPPLATTVNEAAPLANARGSLEHVLLTDLVVDCDEYRDVFEGRLFARGFDSATSPRWIVLIELEPDAACSEDPAALVGTLTPADIRLIRRAVPPLSDHEALLAFLGDRWVTSAVVLRPHRPHLGDLLTYAALTLLGALLVRSGLRQRAATRELLRRITDEPPPPAEAPQQADPYRQSTGGRWLVQDPLRLDEAWLRDRRRQALASGVLAAVVLAATLGWTGAWAVRTVRAQIAWWSGTTAEDVQIAETLGIHLAAVDHSEYVVTYTDAAGRRQHRAVSRTAFMFPVMTWDPPIVRYDADHPEHVAVSWFMDEFSYELALHVLVFIALALPSLAALRRPRRRLRELAAIRDAVHNSPEEVVLTVLSSYRHEIKDQHLRTSYSLQLPEGGTLRTEFLPGERPLFLEIDESKILGLRRPGDLSFAVVLRDDLAPLIPDPHAGDRIPKRWRRDKPA